MVIVLKEVLSLQAQKIARGTKTLPRAPFILLESIWPIIHVPNHFLQKILRKNVISYFLKCNDLLFKTKWLIRFEMKWKKNHHVPKIHSFRNSYAFPFGINPNKFLFYSKWNGDSFILKKLFEWKLELKQLPQTAELVCSSNTDNFI